MAVTFYPKRLLVTTLFLIGFGSVLSMATDVRRGLAVGALALMAYLFIEMFVVFNPARRHHH